MGFYTLLTLLACVFLFIINVVSTDIRTKPLVVKGYDSYLDVTPVKYIVPPGTSKTEFSVYVDANDVNCATKTFDVLLHHGSLPLVQQTNLTFPSNFLVGQPDFIFRLESGVFLRYPLTWPQPGPWFVIAYTEKMDKAIKQKGLSDSDNCVYFFVPTMEYDVAANSTVIDYNGQYEATIGYLGKLFRFQVPPTTMNFTVQLTKCDPSPCNLNLNFLDNNKTSPMTCTGSPQDCFLYVASPSLMDMQHLEMKQYARNHSQNVTFSILVKECKGGRGEYCVSKPKLDRLEASSPLDTVFGDIQRQWSLLAELYLAPVVAVPFDILDPNDVGGTLKWTMYSFGHPWEKDIMVEICGALVHGHLPVVTSDFDLCTSVPGAVRQNFTGTGDDERSLYVPYPKVGIWNIMLQAVCFENGTKTPCPTDAVLQMFLSIQSCVDDGCSDRGSCMSGSISSDLVFYAACQCDAKFQGYACTDDTNAQSVSVQLAGAFLLTMSNLFFCPAIVIAVRRRYLVEAVVYFYNMFFSTFYHACDGMRLQRYRYCMTKYDVLQIGDFFGSACSLWFTLIAMARIRYKYVSPILQLLGPFCLLIGVVYDKTSLYVIVVPIACGLFVIVVSWGQKMYKKRKLYPSWRRYVFFLLPALLLAGAGAAAFSFFETEDNYKYVHSVWHMCIALSICLFLPPRLRDDCNQSLDMSNTSTEPLTPPGIQTSMESGEEINAAFVSDVP